MNKSINSGAAYFLSYLGTLILDFIIKVNPNEQLKSILSFVNIIIRAPKNFFDIVLETTELGNIFLSICGACFIIKIIDFIRENGFF